jgi:hypothetical protein
MKEEPASGTAGAGHGQTVLQLFGGINPLNILKPMTFKQKWFNNMLYI